MRFSKGRCSKEKGTELSDEQQGYETGDDVVRHAARSIEQQRNRIIYWCLDLKGAAFLVGREERTVGLQDQRCWPDGLERPNISLQDDFWLYT